ncbi:MAG TPA: type I polyketide synthase, partial [Streptosporangiaceae bacterium]|nr:type I polyketide synthase [Streptosporangiaceae bacterium]
TWLLVVPDDPSAGDLAGACEQALAAGGAQVVTVAAGPAGLDRETLAARLRVAAADAGELAGVSGVSGLVSLLAVADGEHAGCAGVPAGLAGTLALVQALGDAGIGARLWVLTSGAVTAGEVGPVSVAQAMVWGLGRSVALEHPQRWAGLIDVPPVLTGRMAGWLQEILSGTPGEDQVAVRAGGVLARRLVRAPAPVAGAVLVTGGTGALGAQVARWLAGRGAPQVILVSRRGIAAAGAAGLAARVAGAGSGVTITACDAGDRTDLAVLWARLAAAELVVRGVVHAAGVLDDGVIDALTPARLGAVLAAKAGAAAHLDELAAGTVDGFVLFSSIAGAVGSPGQGNYAAANTALDAVAEGRRARGLAAVSVGWGPWAGGGMAGQAELARAARGGLTAMPSKAAVAVLGRILDLGQAGRGEPSVVVADVDWARFAPGFTASRPSPLLTGIAEARTVLAAVSAEPASAGGRGRLAGRLAGLAVAEQERVALEVVCGEAAGVLGHESSEAVRPGAVFRDLGFDSLTAVEFRNRLSVVTGLSLPATVVFDYPTPRVLAAWLRREVLGHQASAVAVPTVPVVAGDPVVIVAVGCRFPGGVSSPEDLWELVRSGTDAISGFPADRGWDTAAGGFARVGGFVAGSAEFDAGFFGISPREALATDPQQRLLLEVCWEAIERAGIAPGSLRGSRTGVFAGTNGQDYPVVLARAEVEGGIGNAASVMSGRISYVLGLEGPAVSVDTACSSALVALHLACQALRAGECDLALAGGVTVMSTPAIFAEFARQGG